MTMITMMMGTTREDDYSNQCNSSLRLQVRSSSYKYIISSSYKEYDNDKFLACDITRVDSIVARVLGGRICLQDII